VAMANHNGFADKFKLHLFSKKINARKERTPVRNTLRYS